MHFELDARLMLLLQTEKKHSKRLLMTMHAYGSDENLVDSLQDPTHELHEKESAREDGMVTPETQSRQNVATDATEEDHTYILYLIRHGEAKHNVLEKAAREKAKKEAEEQGLGAEETQNRIKNAQAAVLDDPSLLDAPLTKAGEKEAENARNEGCKSCRYKVFQNQRRSSSLRYNELYRLPTSFSRTATIFTFERT